ncbi:HET-domain-containing protein [Trichodelitschia bisporula]|uniref:HET-domain-containing protein n=1 Tax=Trichodelitschia bisporula TaxID=703511 RepID=A0A6G1HW59_9PEZI|nr:HET-domain-containing protein [Trichodelitschia bisporula]
MTSVNGSFIKNGTTTASGIFAPSVTPPASSPPSSPLTSPQVGGINPPAIHGSFSSTITAESDFTASSLSTRSATWAATSTAACRFCSGLSLDALASRAGYLHAYSRSSLVRSAQTCRLCSLLFRKDRSRRSAQLRLSLARENGQTCLRVEHVGGKHRISLSLYTLEGNPATARGITVKRELSHTASPQSFDTAATWIEACAANHNCNKNLPLMQDSMPSRLIDVEAFDNSSNVRLVDNDGSCCKYITLSYCWGKTRTFTTTSRSLRLRKRQISFSALPRTFQDAISIARRLRVRWIWIDAICIIQDDRRDWERESAKMGAVYSMAYLTIAADAGVDCNSGCFNDSSTTQEADFAPLELTSGVFIWDPSRRMRPPEIDGSPLAQRGWVCQERILSPRILHYTRTQLFWECREELQAEDGLRPWVEAETVCGLARNLYGDGDQDNLLHIWYTKVVAQSYSGRRLTLPDDKLAAISGLARAFHRHFDCAYVAGLWLRDLDYGLSWRRRGPATRLAQYRAPSFSWAAIDGVVEWPARSVSALKVEDVWVDLEGEDAHGRVRACWIRVTGQVRRARVVARKRISAGGWDVVWELRSLTDAWLGTAFMDEEEEGSEVECLVLSEKQALILGDGQREGEFVRRGVAEIAGYEGKFTDDGEGMRTVTIF